MNSTASTGPAVVLDWSNLQDWTNHFSRLGPRFVTCSVISLAALANSPAMAEEMLNMHTRLGSSPIWSIKYFTRFTLRLALSLPSR